MFCAAFLANLCYNLSCILYRKLFPRKTKMMVSGAKGRLCVAGWIRVEYVEKELCLTRCGAHSVRSGFMRDAPK